MTYAYTTKAEMVSIMSAEGIQLHSDDSETGRADTGQLDDCIQEATDTVDLFCLRFYTQTILTANSWVRRQASYLACHFLSQRRGDAGIFQERAEKAVAYLERIFVGSLQVPNAATRANNLPTMTNYTIDDRMRNAKLRVVPEISTGKVYPNQHGEISPPPPDYII